MIKENIGSKPGSPLQPDEVVTFGLEIHRRREAKGMTLDQLAERSGLTPNYIGTIENGYRDPSLSTICALAKGLGVMPGELLGGAPGLSAAGYEAGWLYDQGSPEVQVGHLKLLRATSTKRRT